MLKAEGFTVRETEVIAVEIPDQPGGWPACWRDQAQGVNIEYMYAFVGKSLENAIVIFRVEAIDQAVALLKTRR